MKEKIEESLKDIDLKDDIQLKLVICGEFFSAEEKAYIIKHYQHVFDEINIEDFLFILRQSSEDLFPLIDSYLKKRVLSLSVSRIESLVFANKYFNKISNLSSYLLKQPWFNVFKEKYKLFSTAHCLVKMNEIDNVDVNLLKRHGKVLLDYLLKKNNNTELYDLALNNYVSLLKKHSPDYYEEFIKEGYHIIGEIVANNKTLTNNSLIFDCRITSDKIGLETVRFCEIINIPNHPILGQSRIDTIVVNEASVKNMYRNYHNNKLAGEICFHLIGHELYHNYHSFYNKENYKSNLDELGVFYSCLGAALARLDQNLYEKHHDNFAHEYIANIKGLEHRYELHKFFPEIDQEVLEQANRALAWLLLDGYKYEIESGSYITPIEFSKMFYSKQRNVPKYISRFLLNGTIDMPMELKEKEEELTEEEKFMLGYNNKYIGALALICSGKVKSTNIFNDLPIIYERFKDSEDMKEYPHYEGMKQNIL